MPTKREIEAALEEFGRYYPTTSLPNWPEVMRFALIAAERAREENGKPLAIPVVKVEPWPEKCDKCGNEDLTVRVHPFALVGTRGRICALRLEATEAICQSCGRTLRDQPRDDKLDRAAQAVWAVGQHLVEWGHLPRDTREDCLTVARAVLKVYGIEA